MLTLPSDKCLLRFNWVSAHFHMPCRLQDGNPVKPSICKHLPSLGTRFRVTSVPPLVQVQVVSDELFPVRRQPCGLDRESKNDNIPAQAQKGEKPASTWLGLTRRAGIRAVLSGFFNFRACVKVPSCADRVLAGAGPAVFLCLLQLCLCANMALGRGGKP